MLFRLEIVAHGYLIDAVLFRSQPVGRVRNVDAPRHDRLVEVRVESLVKAEGFEKSRDERMKFVVVRNRAESRQRREQMMEWEVRRRGVVEMLMEQVELLDLGDGRTVVERQARLVQFALLDEREMRR